MIQFSNGKFRVRCDFGHLKFYKTLIKKEEKLKNKLESLKKLAKRKATEEKSVEKELKSVLKRIQGLELEYGAPVKLGTRRSFSCRNKWQADLVEKLFKDAQDL